MTIPVEISYKGNHLKVNGEGEIGVVMHTHPPIDESVEAYPFSQWFTDSGRSTGSNDLKVDGSTTPVSFYIEALEDKDIFIKSLSIRISDNGARLNLFGAIAALTNGVNFKYKNNAIGEVVIQDEIKTNLDLVRLGHQTPAVGSGSDAFRADVSGSGADSYLVVLDMEETFGFPWGLRLMKGTKDRLIFEVNDNITGIDTFDIKGFGIQL
jgi:hypothetical protein